MITNKYRILGYKIKRIEFLAKVNRRNVIRKEVAMSRKIDPNFVKHIFRNKNSSVFVLFQTDVTL